ncbi:MAG: MFS transporter [Gammaproteobacteria bacterium]|nr:MFS transporter [Gammaproteobacteria bacterium]
MSALGTLMFNLLPIVIGMSIDTLALSAEDGSLLVSFYFIGFLCACMLSPYVTKQFKWIHVAFVGIFLMIIGLFLIAQVASYYYVLMFFILIGAGSGTLFSLAIVILSLTECPERYFGIKIIFEQITSAILLFIVPTFILIYFGFSGSFLFISLVVFLIGFAALSLPNNQAAEQLIKTGLSTDNLLPKTVNKINIWLALICLCLFFGTLSTLWAFVERLAVANELSADSIGLALSISVLGGAVGGLLAAYLGDRLPLRLSILFIVPLLLTVIWTFYLGFDMWLFGLAAFSLSLLWNFSLTYQMKIVIMQDESKSSWLAAFIALGGIIIPALGGIVLGQFGWHTLFIVISVMLILCSLGFYYLAKPSQTVQQVVEGARIPPSIT